MFVMKKVENLSVDWLKILAQRCIRIREWFHIIMKRKWPGKVTIFTGWQPSILHHLKAKFIRHRGLKFATMVLNGILLGCTKKGIWKTTRGFFREVVPVNDIYRISVRKFTRKEHNLPKMSFKQKNYSWFVSELGIN